MRTILITLLLSALTSTDYAFAQNPAQTETPPAETESPAVESAPDLFARDSYRIDSLVCPFKSEIEYEPGEIECYLLQVPENREKSDSRLIELHFVKLNSRWGREDYDEDRDEEADKHAEGLADGKRDDPVIYLTGGPGAPVAYYVNRFKDHTLLDHRDLYILEQRGIANSGDFCRFFGTRKPEADDVATWAETLASNTVNRTDCATNAAAAGVDLTAYNTKENARDVKVLRRALGFEQWNVWGISYGSVLGQAYIKEDPEGILAVALDAIMPLDIQTNSEHWRVVHWYDRDLQKLQEICQRQPDCASAYPNIPGRLREAVQSIIDEPIEVDVKDVEVYPSGKARIFHDIAALLPFIQLYEQDNYPGLPGLIYAWADTLERRDETFFKALASSVGGGLSGGSDGMYMTIVCNDGHQQAQGLASKRDMEEYPILGQALGTPETADRDTALCVELGMPLRLASDYTAVKTDIPSLIIEGEMDPITPPPNAKAVLPGFANGTYVEFPFAGHGPSRSVTCAGHMLNKFYDDPTAEPDLGCVADMEEPELWAPLYTSSLVPKLLLIYAEDKKKLAIPGAWVGSSILVVLIAFLVLTLAPLLRWIDNRKAADAGRARGFAWLAATTSVTAIGIVGAAFAVTAEASELTLIFGLVPWARYGAWLGPLAGLLGLATMVAIVNARRAGKVPIASLLGLFLTGAAAVGLSSFMLVWGLGPI